MNKSIQKFYLYTISQSIAAFIGGIQWTGLPYFAVFISGNNSYFSILFITQTISSLIFSFIGGVMADKYKAKETIIWLNIILIAVFIVISTIFNLGFNQILLIAILGFVSSLISSLVGSSYVVFYRSIMMETNQSMASLISKTRALTVLAKLIGFSIGPVIFMLLGKNTFWLNALLILVEIFIIYKIIVHANQQPLKSQISIFNINFKQVYNICQTPKIKNILLQDIITGGLQFVVISTILVLISRNNSNTAYVSAFWVIASLGSLFSNAYASFMINKLSYKLQQFSALIVINITFILLFLFNNNNYIIIAIFTLYTLSNPIYGNIQTNYFYQLINERLGTIDGIVGVIKNLLSLLLLFIATLLLPEYMLLIVLTISLFRILFLFFFYQAENNKNN